MRNVLMLTEEGFPAGWISPERAISYHAAEKVAWELGSPKFVFRGGERNGRQSVLKSAAVIAVKGTAGPYKRYASTTIFSNKQLFARDNWTCCYCNNQFASSNLTRDHVIPTSRGGRDTWKNVVSACMPCNRRKGNRLLHRTDMEMHYQPYEPSYVENFVLKGRHLFNEQAEYLRSFLPEQSEAHYVLDQITVGD